MSEDFDDEVRLEVYRHFLDEGRPPTVHDVAEALVQPRDDVEAAFRRLEAGRVLVFAPGTLNIWMANPLCAYPTPYWVETRRGAWWGTCIWDALGISAMLREDASIATACPDCSEPWELVVEDGAPRTRNGIAHFAVPARSWWDNIGYT